MKVLGLKTILSSACCKILYLCSPKSFCAALKMHTREVGMDSNILKISTPFILVSTTVFKFFVFDHENSQIEIKKITKIKKNAYLPYL
jgi:hypothetical protein